jgi:hypothetical protein
MASKKKDAGMEIEPKKKEETKKEKEKEPEKEPYLEEDDDDFEEFDDESTSFASATFKSDIFV